MAITARWHGIGGVSFLAIVLAVCIMAPCMLSANVRVDFPQKLDAALATRLGNTAPNQMLVLWVKLKDRPALDRQAAALWQKSHRHLPPVNEGYMNAISALPEVKFRVVDELFNRVSVELPARAANRLTKLGFVTELSEVAEGIPLKTVDSHTCPDDHYFQRWESWTQADGSSKDFLATHSLRPEITAINIASQHNNPNNYNGSGVVIGIIDSGFQRNNEVFDVVNNPHTKTSDGKDKIYAEKDFTNGLGSNDDGNANTADDEIGHGTNCAGIAAGFDKNGSEYVGVAPDARLAIAKMAYKDNNGEHWPSDMFINALKWLVNDLSNPSVDIISCSVGYWGTGYGPTGYSDVSRWIDWAVKQGKVVCCAIGNDWTDNPVPENSLYAPSDNFNGITVGATVNDGSAITYYSRKGRTTDSAKRLKPDVIAPGGDDTTSPGDKYNPGHYVNWDNVPCLNPNWTAACGWNTGTSFAAPTVAGVVACMMERTPALKGKPLQVRNRLQETATDMGDAGPDTTCGFGLVDAATAAGNAKPLLMIRDTANGVEFGHTTDVGFIPSCDVGGGGANPTPNGIYDGYPTDDPFWTSPDISCDNAKNEPIENTDNTIKVRVTNIGDANAAANSYTVKLYKTNPNTGMKQWDLIGTQAVTPAINAGSSQQVSLTWNPGALNDLGQDHWCLGATVESNDSVDNKAPVPNQYPTGAIPVFNVTVCSTLAIRNFYVQPTGSPVTINFHVQNTTDVPGQVTLQLVPTEPMPSGWTAELSQSTFTLLPGQEAVPAPFVTVYPATSAPPGDRAIVMVQATGPTGEIMGGFGLKVYVPGPTHQPPGTLTLVTGPANPADHLYPAIPSRTYNEMLQIRAAAGGAPPEQVKIKSITLAATGTGDDLADISAVKLWVDINHDGLVQSPGDTLLATGTYDWDNGNVKLMIAGGGYTIAPGPPVDLLVSYTMAGGDPGETYSFQVADVDTVGLSSGMSVSVSGIAMNSCTSTNRPIPTGTLTANLGTYSPPNHWGFVNEDNSIVEVYLAADKWENINLHSITLQANGTGNDAADIASVKLYKDLDNDGVLDAGEPLLGSGVYPADNGAVTIPVVGTSIGKSTGINVLVVYTMGAGGGGGRTYWCYVTAIDATGALTGNQVTKVGLPVASSIKTLGSAGPGGTATIGQWMGQPDGTKVNLQGVVVSVGYSVFLDNRIYVEETNRSHGVAVSSPASGFGASQGDVLTISGVIETDPLTHERRIVQSVVTKTGTTDPPGPLAMSSRYLGGTTFGLYKFGVTGGYGLNNVGLLAKLCGHLVGGDTYNYWIIADGGGGGGGGGGVRVDLTGRKETVQTPPAGSYIALSGVISLRFDTGSSSWIPVLLPAQNSGSVLGYLPWQDAPL